MKNLLFIVAFTATLNNYAQTCGTQDIDTATIAELPWYGNNNWLTHYTDSLEAPFNCNNCRNLEGSTNTLYQIPVNVVVYYNAQYPDIDNGRIEYFIRLTNEHYQNNEVLIQF